MIIVAKNADFSANNLGKIEIDVELSPAVQGMINTIGDVTLSKQNALQKLYDGLVSAGLWAKIDYIFMPILTNNVAKSFVNLKNNNVDFTPSATSYEMNTYGIVSKQAGVGVANTTGFDIGRILNRSYLTRLSKYGVDKLDIGSISEPTFVTGFSSNKGANFFGYVAATGSKNAATKIQSTYFNFAGGTSNPLQTTSFKSLYSINITANTQTAFSKGVQLPDPTQATVTDYTDAKIYPLNYIGSSASLVPVSLFCITNQVLTLAEYQTFNTLLETFESAIGL